jgi:hypothetical protein
MPDTQSTHRIWQQIARELSQEQDVNRVRELSKELTLAMVDAEREKVRKRLRLDGDKDTAH